MRLLFKILLAGLLLVLLVEIGTELKAVRSLSAAGPGTTAGPAAVVVRKVPPAAQKPKSVRPIVRGWALHGRPATSHGSR